MADWLEVVKKEATRKDIYLRSDSCVSFTPA